MSVAKNFLGAVGIAIAVGVTSTAWSKGSCELCKLPYPTFKMKSLNECDKGKIEKFRDTFKSLAKELKYDKKAQLKIEKDCEVEDKRLQENRDEKINRMTASGVPWSKACDKCWDEYWESYFEMIGREVEKRHKGVCRGFADLLVCKGREIGLDVYRLCSDNHAANIYKIDGKWYVADLTTQITSPNLYKDSKYFYRMPLEY